MTYIPEIKGFFNPDKLPIGSVVPYANPEYLPRLGEMWKLAGTELPIDEYPYLADFYKHAEKGRTIKLPEFNESTIYSNEYIYYVDFNESDWTTEERYRILYTDSLIGTHTINSYVKDSTFFNNRTFTNSESTITAEDFPSNEIWWIHEVAQCLNIKLMTPQEEAILISNPNDIKMYYGLVADYDDAWYTGRNFIFYNASTHMHMIVFCHAAGRRKLTRTDTFNETTTSFSDAFSGRGDGGLYITTTEYLSEVVPLRGKFAKLTNFEWVKTYFNESNGYELLVEDYQNKG